MIKTELIDSALKLTGKTMEDMEGDIWKFSMPRFCYYLLSSEFIEKYSEISIKLDRRNNNYKNDDNYKDSLASDFGYAIRKYQSGNEQPLIELLSKIGVK